jgi:hypothetical protein
VTSSGGQDEVSTAVCLNCPMTLASAGVTKTASADSQRAAYGPPMDHVELSASAPRSNRTSRWGKGKDIPAGTSMPKTTVLRGSAPRTQRKTKPPPALMMGRRHRDIAGRHESIEEIQEGRGGREVALNHGCLSLIHEASQVGLFALETRPRGALQGHHDIRAGIMPIGLTQKLGHVALNVQACPALRKPSVPARTRWSMRWLAVGWQSSHGGIPHRETHATG